MVQTMLQSQFFDDEKEVSKHTLLVSKRFQNIPSPYQRGFKTYPLRIKEVSKHTLSVSLIIFWPKSAGPEITKVSKGAKIRNRYNQVPHLTQDTNGKVTNSPLDTTNESQEVSLFPAGDHKAHINRRAQRHSKHKTEQNIKYPQKKYRLGTVSKIFYWRA